MQILTDILSLFKRKKIIKETTPEDLVVIGKHEEPDMLGTASPIPYKSVKLIKVKDLIKSASCDHANLNNGTSTNPIGVYANTTSDPCVVNMRSITAIGNNISASLNNNEIEVSTTGEPNDGINIGSGVEIFESKVGESLRFRTLTSSNETINIVQNGDNIDIVLNKVLLAAPDGGIWELTVDNTGQLTTILV